MECFTVIFNCLRRNSRFSQSELYFKPRKLQKSTSNSFNYLGISCCTFFHISITLHMKMLPPFFFCKKCNELPSCSPPPWQFKECSRPENGICSVVPSSLLRIFLFISCYFKTMRKKKNPPTERNFTFENSATRLGKRKSDSVWHGFHIQRFPKEYIFLKSISNRIVTAFKRFVNEAVMQTVIIFSSH